jgi:hypothetical protein
VTTYHQESGTNRPAAITDAAVSLVVGWIIYWVGVAIYRAFANRRGQSSTLPVTPDAAKPRQRKKLRSFIVVGVLIVAVVVGLDFAKGTGPNLTTHATLSDYYPCLDVTKAHRAFAAGGVPSQSLINALISTGKTASDPVIRKGAKQMAAAYRLPISNNAGTYLVEGMGTIMEGCNALHDPAP